MSESLKPSMGLLTWHAEGNNNPGSPFYSRKAHWPGGASGVTIGRGYDMKERTVAGVRADLIASGLSSDVAGLLALGAGMSGANAKGFTARDDIKTIELTEAQQVHLFEISFPKYVADAHRLCSKADVVKKYGECNWGKMETRVKELITDMRFRGDYDPVVRSKIQSELLSGDLDRIIKGLEVIRTLKNVPRDRHDRRVKYLMTGGIVQLSVSMVNKSSFNM